MPVTDKDITSVSAAKVKGLWHVSPWGRTLYVNSAHSRASDVGPDGLDKDHPLATLAKALTYAQAGDMIVVGPGHAETVTSATALVVAVNDVYIRGIGKGLRRPKFTMGTVITSSFGVTAQGVILENLHFAPGIDGVQYLVGLVGSNVDVLDCYISDTAGYQPIYGIKLDPTAEPDDVRIIGLRADQPNAGGTGCIVMSVSRRVEIRDCHITGNYSQACIQLGAAAEQVLIARNWLQNLHAVVTCIKGFAAATGRVADNRCRIATDAATTWINTPGAMDLYENYGVNDDGETGKLIGTASV